MTHVVPSDHIRAVGQSLRMPVIGGAQQQSGGIDRSTRDNHNVPGVCLERAVTFHNDSIDFVASRIGFQTLYEGVGQQRDVGMLHCGIHA